jgi:hypothetical protein
MLQKQSLSNLKLSLLGKAVSTGGEDFGTGGARISINDTFRSVQTIYPWIVEGNSFEGQNNISLSSLMGQHNFPSGTQPGSQVAYVKRTPVDAGQWRSDLGTYYTSNSGASGALIAGTNGDLNGSFLGFGPNYESYWMWGGASKHWRIGVNIYRLSADGHEFQRVYTHHHLVDSISDQSSLSVGLGGMNDIGNTKYGGVIWRNQATGEPNLAIGAYSISANTFNNNGWMSNITLSGVNAWGQPLDAIDIGPDSGIMLWQRQWWGPRLVLFKRSGTGLSYQSMQALDVFYQSWICDHNFGGQGGVAYSPVSNQCMSIFTYEPNGTTWGRNLALNSVRIMDPDNPYFEGEVTTHLLHFIWGGSDPCREDLGQYSAAAIDWLGFDSNLNSDVIAYAYIVPNTGTVYVHASTRNWDEPNNNKCSFPDIGMWTYGGVNTVQRLRVTRLSSYHHTNGGLIAHFAVSYVDSSNNTQVKVYRVESQGLGAEEIASYTPNARGLLARNGGGAIGRYSGVGRGNHLVVVGTTNDGLQDTYIWGGKSGSLSRSGDQDLTRAIKFV